MYVVGQNSGRKIKAGQHSPLSLFSPVYLSVFAMGCIGNCPLNFSRRSASRRFLRRYIFRHNGSPFDFKFFYFPHVVPIRCNTCFVNRLYHRLTRGNTPDSMSFRCFLPFLPWWVQAKPASQKPKIARKSIAGRCFAVLPEQQMRPDKKSQLRILAILSRGLDAMWAHLGPSKPCLLLSIDGIIAGTF